MHIRNLADRRKAVGTCVAFVCIFFLSTQAASARELFVKPECVNGQSPTNGACSVSRKNCAGIEVDGWCSVNNECTLADANRCVLAGDSVNLRGGIYRTQIRPASNGSASSRITYRPVPASDDVAVLTTSGGRQITEGAIGLGQRSYVTVTGDPDNNDDGGKRLRIELGENPSNAFANVCGGSYNIVENVHMDGNVIHGVAFCVYWWDRDSNGQEYETAYNVVRDNLIKGRGRTLRDCKGTAIGTTEDLVNFAQNAHHNLLHGNDIRDASHVTVTFNQSPNARYNVVRNNTIFNSYHTAMDLWGAGEHNLVEGNVMSASASKEPNECPGNALQMSASDAIVRYNVITRGGSDWNQDRSQQNRSIAGIHLHAGVDDYSGNNRVSRGNRFYNNTLVKNKGAAISIMNGNSNNSSLENNRFVNNILYDNNRFSPEFTDVAVLYEGFSESDIDHQWRGNAIDGPNVSVETPVIRVQSRPYSIDDAEFQVDPSTCQPGGPAPPAGVFCNGGPKLFDPTSHAGKPVLLGRRYPTFADSVAGDPRFVGYNSGFSQDADGISDEAGGYQLANGSAMIDAGVPLTFVTSNNNGGNTVAVEDARFFQDGMGGGIDGVVGDTIAVGTRFNSARVTSVNYGSNTLVLATAIDASNGSPVWLFSDSRGSAVLLDTNPDVGACEYSGACGGSGEGISPPLGDGTLSATPESGEAPLTVQFDGSSFEDAGGTAIYRYDFDDGSGTYDSGPIVEHTFTEPRVYRVTLVALDRNNPATVLDDDSVLITVEAGGGTGGGPNANFISSAAGDSPLTVQFDGSASSANVVIYRFDFGDYNGTFDGVPTVQHTYAEPGDYNVVLQVFDAQGNSDAASTTVTVATDDPRDDDGDDSGSSGGAPPCRVVNRTNGRVLTVVGGVSEGAQVVTANDFGNAQPNQLWHLRDGGNGYVKLVSEANTGLALGIPDGDLGVATVLTAASNAANQRFALEWLRDPDNHVRLIIDNAAVSERALLTKQSSNDSVMVWRRNGFDEGNNPNDTDDDWQFFPSSCYQ